MTALSRISAPTRVLILESLLMAWGVGMIVLAVGWSAGIIPLSGPKPHHHISRPTNTHEYAAARAVADEFAGLMAAGNYAAACTLANLPNCATILQQGLKGTTITISGFKEQAAGQTYTFTYSGTANSQPLSWSETVTPVNGVLEVTHIQ